MRVPGRLVYDPAGNPIKITNPDGFAITFQYDEANRAIRAVDQEGNQVFTHRDVDGRPKCSKDPNGNSVFYTYWDNTRDSKLRRVTAPAPTPVRAWRPPPVCRPSNTITTPTAM